METAAGECPVKICIFTETYYPVMGGGETQANILAEGLISGGHSVLVLTRRSDTSLKSYERHGKVDVYRLAPTGGGQLKKWGLLFSSIPALIRLRHRYDLIFVSGYRIIGLTAVLVGKLIRKPVILKADSQGEMSGEFFDSGLKKIGISHSSFPFNVFLWFRNYILKKADRFSAISPEIGTEWTTAGIPSDNIHLIPNAVDTVRFVHVESVQKARLRKKLGLPPDAVIAIYTGRLVSYKGLPLLLRVWKDICCKHENALLLLAGTGGLDIHNCEAELREFVASSNMEKHVLFLGAVKNVEEYLQAADVFVFPTENDAFPSSVVEAMACELPVVTTPVGAIKTVIAHKETGWLIQPRNDQQLFDALHVLLSDPQLASRLGLAARQSVQEKYSAKTVTGKYLSLFQELLDLQ
jgi:glycosyltransferase involved in cell wall biosynthesis